METDIRLFANNIVEKTGIDISIYNEDGVFLFGESKEKKIDTNFNGIKLDTEKDSTFFRIKNNKRTYIARIKGAGTTEKTYANLIIELCSSFSIKDEFSKKEEFIEALLLGELNDLQKKKFKKKFLLENGYYAMSIIFPREKEKDVVNVITNYAENNDIVVLLDDSSCVYVREITAEREGCSVYEFALVFAQSIYEETGVKVKIGIGGEVREIEQLQESYFQAISALKFAKTFENNNQIFYYRDFVTIKILEEVPKENLGKILSLMVKESAREIFLDDEMNLTAQSFLENDLNISETARKMYLHRNTLTYRLDKIQRLTGLDIRKFADAMSFRLAFNIFSLLKGEENAR